MNYLGHAVLSFNQPEVITGNMIGDHVKGLAAKNRFPAGIWAGVMLHRKIDGFSDAHPAVKRVKVLFREDYGLYSGAIMDTINDHFLANDPVFFSGEQELVQFANHVYDSIEANRDHLPDGFKVYFEYMVRQNWLLGYRNLGGIKKALGGLHRRAKHMPDPEKAYEIFITNFYQLNNAYFELMGDLTKYAKSELAILTQ